MCTGAGRSDLIESAVFSPPDEPSEDVEDDVMFVVEVAE